MKFQLLLRGGQEPRRKSKKIEREDKTKEADRDKEKKEFTKETKIFEVASPTAKSDVVPIKPKEVKTIQIW